MWIFDVGNWLLILDMEIVDTLFSWKEQSPSLRYRGRTRKGKNLVAIWVKGVKSLVPIPKDFTNHTSYNENFLVQLAFK